MISTGYESLPHYAHNPKVGGSNPPPATKYLLGLAAAPQALQVLFQLEKADRARLPCTVAGYTGRWQWLGLWRSRGKGFGALQFLQIFTEPKARRSGHTQSAIHKLDGWVEPTAGFRDIALVLLIRCHVRNV